MISIVMTYHNRRTQLLNTLASIRYFGHDPEIIVVDDASTERIDDIGGIKLIRIEPEDKWWFNSCMAFNIGFAHATGDIIILQNAECMHMGDILGYAKDNIKDGQYTTFGAYSMDYPLEITDYGKQRDKLYSMVLKNRDQHLRGHQGWYNHTKYRPLKYHFCAAITRHDLERINGFDERYAMGIAHDDCEILVRIKNAGIISSIVNIPFVIHQWHKRTNAKVADPRWQRNFHLYNEVTLKEKIVAAPENKYYVKN